MAKILFTRTVNGVPTDFEVCVGVENDNPLTPKEMYDNEENVWLLVHKKGVPILYQYRGLAEKNSSYPKSVTIKYDILSLVPDMTESTRGGNSFGITQKWNYLPLIKYLEPIAFDTEGESKRGINGILEREFGCLPIFDPMGTQDPIIDEGAMLVRAGEFQTILAGL